jgi:hypothetical protein
MKENMIVVLKRGRPRVLDNNFSASRLITGLSLLRGIIITSNPNSVRELISLIAQISVFPKGKPAVI